MSTTLKLSIEYIKSDLFRYTGKVSVPLFFMQMAINRSFRYTFWFRLAKIRNPIIRIIARVVHHRLSMKYGIQIPRITSIGYGLYIGHHMCVVVSPTARIGNNCNLSQFTTIGSNHNRAAIIGDNVYVGPNVCIVENVKVGNNSTIGAGSVVVKDVPENATVAGCPARVVSEKSPGRYINNKWPVNC